MAGVDGIVKPAVIIMAGGGGVSRGCRLCMLVSGSFFGQKHVHICKLSFCLDTMSYFIAPYHQYTLSDEYDNSGIIFNLRTMLIKRRSHLSSNVVGSARFFVLAKISRQRCACYYRVSVEIYVSSVSTELYWVVLRVVPQTDIFMVWGCMVPWCHGTCSPTVARATRPSTEVQTRGKVLHGGMPMGYDRSAREEEGWGEQGNSTLEAGGGAGH